MVLVSGRSRSNGVGQTLSGTPPQDSGSAAVAAYDSSAAVVSDAASSRFFFTFHHSVSFLASLKIDEP